MSVCQYCGEEIEWRTIKGRPVPIHPNGGWECSGPRLETNRERSCWRTKCPRCGAAHIYFVRHNGGSVWFDELGQPWPIHGCFANEPASRALEKIRKVAAGINRQPILGVVAAKRIISNQTAVAIELFNGRRACVTLTPTTPLAIGSPIALFRETDSSKGVLLTELNSRLPILDFVASGALGLAEGWADCTSYADLESPVEALQFTLRATGQVVTKSEPMSFTEAARLVEKIEATGNHNVMVDSLVGLARSTPSEKIASDLAAAAAKIQAALKQNTGFTGHQRFRDELIAEWMKLQNTPQVITIETLKSDHTAAVQKVKELVQKLEAAGVKLPSTT